MADREIIELKPEHRGNRSHTFTGRPQGNQVRKDLALDLLDKSSKNFIITIPTETTSFNASFYLGLFFRSIEKLKGVENFKNKYKIQILESNPEVLEGLSEDLKECERQAENEYKQETGLSFFE